MLGNLIKGSWVVVSGVSRGAVADWDVWVGLLVTEVSWEGGKFLGLSMVNSSREGIGADWSDNWGWVFRVSGGVLSNALTRSVAFSDSCRGVSALLA